MTETGPVAAPAASAEAQDIRDKLREIIKPPPEIYKRVIAASILINVFTFILPLISMAVYQTVLPASAVATLIALTLGVLVIIVFDWLFNYYRGQLVLAAQTQIDMDLARRIYERIAYVRLDGRIMNGSALLTTIRDFDQVRSSLASGMLSVLADLPFLFLFLIFLVIASPPVGVVALIGCAVIMLSGWHNGRQTEKLHSDLGKVSSERHSVLLATVRDFVQVRTTGWIDRMVERHRPVADQIALASAHLNRSNQNAGIMTRTLVQAVQTLTTLTGAWAVIHGQLGMAGLIGLTMLAARTAGMAGQIAAVYPRWIMAQKSLRAVEEALMLPQEKTAGKAYIQELPSQADINLESVQFTYPDMPIPALGDVNVQFPAGKTILIMGASGSGKSTLLKLVMGLYAPTQGHVRYGQIDISFIDPTIYRTSYASVLAEPVLYGQTLAEWFSVDMPPDSLERARKILVDLGFAALIKQHPAGVHRPLDNGGQGLSIGQKKAAALVRALLQKRPVLILDEPTEGMDRETRGRILSLIKSQAAESTVIIASHDEQALEIADYILILGAGRMLAFDTREQIIAKIGGKKPLAV